MVDYPQSKLKVSHRYFRFLVFEVEKGKPSFLQFREPGAILRRKERECHTSPNGFPGILVMRIHSNPIGLSREDW